MLGSLAVTLLPSPPLSELGITLSRCVCVRRAAYATCIVCTPHLSRGRRYCAVSSAATYIVVHLRLSVSVKGGQYLLQL